MIINFWVIVKNRYIAMIGAERRRKEALFVLGKVCTGPGYLLYNKTL